MLNSKFRNSTFGLLLCMPVFNLPDDIFTSKTDLKRPIIIHYYSSTTSHINEKSILHRNAVSLVISGQKTIRFSEASVNTNHQEIHFLSSGNSIASFDVAQQKKFESILLFFDDKTLTEFIVDNARLIDKKHKNLLVQPSRYVSIKKDEFINNYIKSMQLMIARAKAVSDEMTRLKLWELMLYLLENRSNEFLSFLKRREKIRNETAIRTVAETNVGSNLTVDELAFLCNLSISTFKRQFVKIYDVSPSVWFAEQKMKLAAQYLINHELKPGEIWFKLGYESHSSFTKSFRKYFGLSPTIYVEKMNQKEQELNQSH